MYLYVAMLYSARYSRHEQLSPKLKEDAQRWGASGGCKLRGRNYFEFEMCTQPNSFFVSFLFSLGNASLFFFVTFNSAHSHTPHTCRQQ